MNARHVPTAVLYDTLCDVVVVAEGEAHSSLSGTKAGGGLKINPSFLRPHMQVIDLTQMVGDSTLMKEARSRGCKVIEPSAVLADYLAQTFKAISTRDLDPALAMAAIAAERPVAGV
ncbi:MAG: hypothetical protein EHM42_03700 [Planctomycetaceae bacterium]|nr:MAG: hypothetical protein EHM42_03700 [Planctomycetaceae bacterium]